MNEEEQIKRINNNNNNNNNRNDYNYEIRAFRRT